MKSVYFFACIAIISTSTVYSDTTTTAANSIASILTTAEPTAATDNDSADTNASNTTTIIEYCSHIFTNLLQTIMHIFDSPENDSAQNKLIMKKYLAQLLDDEQLQQEIVDIATQQITDLHNETQKTSYKATAKDKAETEIVLGHFAHIVGSVFNILREPEDKPTIVNNIVNIIANTAQIALLGRKSGKLSSHADIEQYVAQINDETKLAIGTMITQAAG